MNEKDLLRKIETGAPSQKDKAAEEICNKRLKGTLSDVMRLLQKDDPLIRANAIIILGVLESKKKLLEKIVRSDSSRDVRVAAEVMIENFGKITYEEAKNKINTARVGKDIEEKEETEKKEKPLKKKHISKNYKIIFSFAAATVVVLLLIIIFYPKNKEILRPSQKTFTDELKGRFDDITDFRTSFISSNGPNTIKLKTYNGDTYSSLLEKIYDVPEISVSGKNTVYAFFRKYNFGGLKIEKKPDLLKMETSAEELIFPNLAAMHLEFDLREGSAAYQYIVKPDDSLEISISVDKVIVK